VRSVGGGLGANLASSSDVECRIEVARARQGHVIYLAGRFNSAQVSELRQLCATLTPPLRIDLTDLLSVDTVGLDVLRRLRQGGTELVSVPRYLRRWLM
jgi:anti-anti-sigma regulatory factor